MSAGRRVDTTALAVGSALSGLLAYVVFALTTRVLGAEAAAPVSVLWSYWGLTGAALTFPLQHWIARSVIAHGEGAVRRAAPQLVLVVAAISVVMGALSWLGRDLLFHADGVGFPLLVALVTFGSALIGVVRGRLSASGRFISVATSLVAENAVRCVAVGALATAGVESAFAYGLCLVLGHLVALLWPDTLRFSKRRTGTTPGTPLAFLSGAATAQLIGQFVLTGGPVALALAGGTAAEVTALFAAFALFRAPYLLALGVVSQLTAKVAGLVVAGEAAAMRRLQHLVIAATVVAVVLAAGVGAWLGDPLLGAIFGAEIGVGTTHSAVIAAACTLAVSNLVAMVIILAQDRPRATVRSWLVAVLVGAIAFAAMTALQPTEQIVWSFLVAELTAFVMLVANRTPRAAASPNRQGG